MNNPRFAALCLGLASLAFSPLADAKDGGCDGLATEKKLSGAARTSFLKKCQADAASITPASAASSGSPATSSVCETKAADKKLAGAAKTSFLKKCEKDAAASSAASSCEAKAADKKLAGAAKTSFMKKCVSSTP